MAVHELSHPTSYWKCPSCGFTEEAALAPNQARMHECPALGGMAVPLESVARPDDDAVTRHRMVLAEDYTAGRNPVTAVALDRPDGSNDVNVFAQPATGHIST